MRVALAMPEIEAEELIVALAKVGVVLSRDQLRRLHKRGLIPKPRQEALLGRRATRTLYPEGTLEQAIEAARLLRSRRDFEWVGWKMYLKGFPVAPRYRSSRLLPRVDEAIAYVRELFDRDDESGIAALADFLFTLKTDNRIFKAFRSAVGRAGFEVATRVVLEIAAGCFFDLSSQPELDDPDRLLDAKLIDAALGLSRARTDYFEGSSPLLKNGDYSSVLRDISNAVGRRCLTEVAGGMLDSEKRDAAQELKAFFAVFTAFSKMVCRLTTRPMFGLHRIAGFYDELDLETERLLVLLWAVYRRAPGVQDGMRSVLQAGAGLTKIDFSLVTGCELPKLKMRQTIDVFPHAVRSPDSLGA
jgi:hypothetical protein